MVDAQTGSTDIDKQIAKILYPHRDKVMLVANKADSPKNTVGTLRLFTGWALASRSPSPPRSAATRATFWTSLGADPGDAKHRGRRQTRPDAHRRGGQAERGQIFDRQPAAGLGKTDRHEEIPGTTRDAIDSLFRYHGKEYILIDTAGLRRKAKVAYGVEYYSVMRTIEAVDRCDVVVVLASDEEISVQDVKIASYAKRRMKEILVVFNKWDLVAKDTHSTGKFISELHRQMPFLQFAPVQFISTLTGQRINRIMETVVKIERGKRKADRHQRTQPLHGDRGGTPPAHTQHGQTRPHLLHHAGRGQAADLRVLLQQPAWSAKTTGAICTTRSGKCSRSKASASNSSSRAGRKARRKYEHIDTLDRGLRSGLPDRQHPSATFWAKVLHRKDIRSGGSGNIGATNALRQYGAKTGILVLARWIF